MTTEFDKEEVARQVAEKLQEKFPDTDAATVTKIVNEEVAALAERPVHDYVAVLSERAARKRLKKLD
jgi:translation initiation factor 2 alpha subunit (eIF-2alpha)